VPRTTRLGENFTWKQLLARFDEAPLPLFAIDERGNLQFAHEGRPLEPRANWRVTLLSRERVSMQPAEGDGAGDAGAPREPETQPAAQ